MGMDTLPIDPLPSTTKPGKALDRLLGQNERVKDLVEGCAEERIIP